MSSDQKYLLFRFGVYSQRMRSNLILMPELFWIDLGGSYCRYSVLIHWLQSFWPKSTLPLVCMKEHGGRKTSSTVRVKWCSQVGYWCEKQALTLPGQWGKLLSLALQHGKGRKTKKVEVVTCNSWAVTLGFNLAGQIYTSSYNYLCVPCFPRALWEK